MSVGLYKYNGNIFDDAKEILSENKHLRECMINILNLQ